MLRKGGRLHLIISPGNLTSGNWIVGRQELGASFRWFWWLEWACGSNGARFGRTLARSFGLLIGGVLSERQQNSGQLLLAYLAVAIRVASIHYHPFEFLDVFRVWHLFGGAQGGTFAVIARGVN